jgi:hypothetical protein
MVMSSRKVDKCHARDRRPAYTSETTQLYFSQKMMVGGQDGRRFCITSMDYVYASTLM